MKQTTGRCIVLLILTPLICRTCWGPPFKTTALHRQIESCQPIQKNMRPATVNASDSWGNTPLHIAAWRDDAPAVQQLIVQKAAVNTRNNAGETPLYTAASARSFAVVILLLQAGADGSIADDEGATPGMIHPAVKRLIEMPRLRSLRPRKKAAIRMKRNTAERAAVRKRH